MNILCAVAFLILYAHPSVSFLIRNGCQQLPKKVNFRRFLKITDSVDDLVITSTKEFEQEIILESQKQKFSNGLKTDNNSPSLNTVEEFNKQRRSQFFETSMFLLRAAIVGVATGGTGVFPMH